MVQDQLNNSIQFDLIYSTTNYITNTTTNTNNNTFKTYHNTTIITSNISKNIINTNHATGEPYYARISLKTHSRTWQPGSNFQTPPHFTITFLAATEAILNIGKLHNCYWNIVKASSTPTMLQFIRLVINIRIILLNCVLDFYKFEIYISVADSKR